MFEYEFVAPGELEVVDGSENEDPCGFEFCYANVEFCWFGQLVSCSYPPDYPYYLA